MSEDQVSEQHILEAVDKFADSLDPDEVEYEAKRLAITVDDLLQRITVEIKARLDG